MKQREINVDSVFGGEDATMTCNPLSKLVTVFAQAIKDDTRISPVHISLYMAMLYCWHKQKFVNPIYIFSNQLMPLAKISGLATYHRTIRELNEYGYIRYVPSFNPALGSKVYFPELKV